MTLCDRCQVIFHAQQRAVGIDLRHTRNPLRRLIRALKMTLLFMWMLVDMLETEMDQDIEEFKALRTNSTGKGLL
jgi:hypothetical protein